MVEAIGSTSEMGYFNIEMMENKEEKGGGNLPPVQPTVGGSLEKVQAEEKIRSAEVLKQQKNQEVYKALQDLLSRMKSEEGTKYPDWVDTLQNILDKNDTQCYRDHYETFSKVIEILIHPPEDTPPSIYVPLLWDLSKTLIWIDLSKSGSARAEYFFASHQVPSIVSQAKKELELGNQKKCEALLTRAKEFVEFHYSNIPLLSDRRSEERAAFALAISEVERKYDQEAAINTLARHVSEQSNSMDLNTFAGKWTVILVLIYVSRRAIFG